MRLLFCLLFALLITAATPAAAQDSLRIKVAIRYEVGGAQAVTHTDFQLLDANANAILRPVYAPAERASGSGGNPAPVGLAPIKPRGAVLVGKEEATPLKTYAAACAVRSQLCGPGYDALSEHVVARQRTDLSGFVTFRNLEPGTYYLFGRTTTRGDGIIYWHERVSVPATGTLELSDANATVILN